MALNETMAAVVQQNLEMLKGHMGDFNDAEWMTRPVPAANHTAWQMTHLAQFDVMVAGVLSPGGKVSVPSSFEQVKGKEASKSDDPQKFPTKAEVLKVMDEANALQVAALKKMTDADFAKPSPEQFQSFAPDDRTSRAAAALARGEAPGPDPSDPSQAGPAGDVLTARFIYRRGRGGRRDLIWRILTRHEPSIAVTNRAVSNCICPPRPLRPPRFNPQASRTWKRVNTARPTCR